MFGTFLSHLVQIFFCNLSTTPSLFGETRNNNRQNSSFEKKTFLSFFGPPAIISHNLVIPVLGISSNCIYTFQFIYESLITSKIHVIPLKLLAAVLPHSSINRYMSFCDIICCQHHYVTDVTQMNKTKFDELLNYYLMFQRR